MGFTDNITSMEKYSGSCYKVLAWKWIKGPFGLHPKDLLASYLLEKDLFYFLRVFGY